MCLLASGGLLAAWTAGKIVSDRYIWSQFLSWMPSLLMIPAAALLWLQALAFANVSGRRWPGQRLATRVVEVWVLLAAAYWGLIECRVYRVSLPARPTGPHLRVLNWNVNEIQKMDPIARAMLPLKPDVAILVNPHSYGGWSQAPAVFGPEYQYTNVGGIVILSRAPVLRYGMAWLGLEPAPGVMGSGAGKARKWVDPGRAMYVELDTTAQFGRTSIVWVLDLPSEPGLSRWELVSHAAAGIRNWSGGATPTQGFPAPDLIVGDFNIPRGSVSLTQLAPDMRNAFDEAGTGYGATWPRYGFRTPIPLLQIDQMFVGPRLRAARYEIIDGGAGFHRLQVGDLVARP